MPDDGSWLDLLLSDAPLDAFEEHRRAAAEAARGDAERSSVERTAGTAFRLKALLTQQKRRSAELAALNDIASRLTTLHDLPNLLREVVVQAQRLLDVDLAYLALADEDRSHMRIEVASGSFTPQLLGIRLPLDAGLVGHVIRKGVPRWTNDYASDTGFVHAPEADAAARAEHIHSLLVVPLIVRDTTIGALLASERYERPFRDEEITLLSALAAHAAIAIDNARLVSEYQRNLNRLNEVNAELGARTAELQRNIRWQQTLTQVVLRGGGVPELLREVSSLFSGDIGFTEDLTDLGLADDVDSELVDAAFGGGRDGDDERRSVVVEGRDGFVCAVGVRAGAMRLGLLLLRTPSHPGDAERVLLESTAPAIALSVTAEQAVTEATARARGAFLEDLLSTPGSSERVQARQARLAGIDLAAAYCVMVIDADGEQPGLIRKSVSEFANRHGCRMVERADDFILVAASTGPDQLVTSWSAVPIPVRPTCGVAGPATGAEPLAQALADARRVVHTLRIVGRAGDTATTQELGIYRVLLTPFGRSEVRQMTDTMLAPLTREQERTGVPLERTLEVLFEEGKHSRSAATLGIHVNTLYQRLETIDRILGADWRRADRAFELHTALRLRRLAAQLDQHEPPGPN